MLNLEVSQDDFRYIRQIADRAFSAGIYSVADGETMLDAIMDLEAVHNGCPLDLPALIRASDIHFAHDVAGIRAYLDRDTGRLMDHFTPRFTKAAS
jgi:hypothetical protein